MGYSGDYEQNIDDHQTTDRVGRAPASTVLRSRLDLVIYFK